MRDEEGVWCRLGGSIRPGNSRGQGYRYVYGYLYGVIDGILYGAHPLFPQKFTHTAHMPLWGASEALYGLKDLAKALGDVGALPAPHRGAQTVLDSTAGRNVALFNLTRQWAYRARLRYTDFTEWSETVYAFASMKNASVIADEFSRGPMSEGEVAQIAQSIASWVWTRITPEQTEANRKRWAKNLAQGRMQKMKGRLEVLEKMNYEHS